MIVRNFARFCAFPAIFTLVLLTDATASKPVITPGTYRDWNGDMDEVTILQTFRLDAYNNIAVESFDTSRVTLPSPKENTYEAVRSALTTIKPAFIEGFQKNLRQRSGGPNPARGKGQTLVVRARLTRLDPGSQATRYWVGFGAGTVKIEMIGEVVDVASHKTLIRFKQERRSGFGVFGGGYGELFSRTAHQIGEDVAGLLNAF